MWLLFARGPRPDSPVWRGRCWLAALDAVAWPLGWLEILRQGSVPDAASNPFVLLVTLSFALVRLHQAAFANHRYRFTTWRWGRVTVGLLLLGALVKLTVSI